MARKSTLESARGSDKLIKLARENAFQTFTFEETAQIFGWGRNIPTQLASLGAPTVARRFNPKILLEWISQNPGKLEKIRDA